MSLLELKNVSLSVDKQPILTEVNMEIEEGKTYAIVGPNGAGKSSLAFSVMGLDGYKDIQGDILFEGQSLKPLSIEERAGRGISLAWQEPARYEGLTVERFLSAAKDGGGGETPERALEMIGMEPTSYMDRAMDAGLSGGERKKIELASLLTMQPRLILLDEPDSGIDVASLEKIFEILDLMAAKGVTVTLITHSATVLRQAEYAYLMCCGRVIDQGPVNEIQPYFEDKCIPCDHPNQPRKAGEA